MRRNSVLTVVMVLLAGLAGGSAAFAAKVGEAAPVFTGKDSKGHDVSLAKYKGKLVVLEWHNKDCPYVKAQYESGKMQKLQKAWTAKGVIWLAVVSSAPGKQGYVDAAGAQQDLKTQGAAPTAMVLDPDGKIGRLYGAETTPHMFIVDRAGTLVYNGALDDHPTTDKSDVATPDASYVSAALGETLAGKAVSHPTSKPYGCSVKYP